MKAVASDEERQRQLELKKKREEQAIREALDRQHENELREMKKQEREKRRLLNEQRRNEKLAEEETSSSNENLSQTRKLDKGLGRKNKGFIRTRLWTLFFFSLFVFVAFNLVFGNFCDKKNRSSLFKSDFFKDPSISLFVRQMENEGCPRFYEFNDYIGLTSAKNFVSSKIAQIKQNLA